MTTIAILKRKFISGHDYQIGHIEDLREGPVFMAAPDHCGYSNKGLATRQAKQLAKLEGIAFNPAIVACDYTRKQPTAVKTIA